MELLPNLVHCLKKGGRIRGLRKHPDYLLPSAVFEFHGAVVPLECCASIVIRVVTGGVKAFIDKRKCQLSTRRTLSTSWSVLAVLLDKNKRVMDVTTKPGAVIVN